MKFEEIISFWFEEIESKAWFTADKEFDRQLAQRFGKVHGQATRLELFEWRSHPLGRLAEIIVLDQFSRNLFRDSAEAFACDGIALALAQEAIRTGDDQKIEKEKRAFFYMPFMHSESIVIQGRSIELFQKLDYKNYLGHAINHQEKIQRFGRYPHRNAVLGRKNTPAEEEFLLKK